MISHRTKKISPSATLAIDAKAKELKAKGEDVIGFGAGEPDFDTPKYIKDAAKKALDDGFVGYVPTLGVPELREAIAEKLEKENNVSYIPDDVIVSTGAKQILYEAMLAVVNPGDGVLIPDPWWVSYVPMVQMAQGEPVFVPTYEKDKFRLIPEIIEEKITDKTKAIVINSPNNPTGAVLNKNDMRKIADICIEHDLIAVSDEIYEKIIYDEEHVSIASFNEMKNRTITVNGFSKAYAMTGWRLGYAAGPAEIIKAMNKIQAHSVSCATSFVQKAGVAALKGTENVNPGDDIKAMVSEFRKRRDFIVGRVGEIDGLSISKPEGAFYAFVNVSDYEKDSMKFCAHLLDLEGTKVAAVPGIAFGTQGEGFIRLSYATSMENIVRGLDVIEKALECY
ncbi:MAG: aspartate aminotransferase [Candidatus Altiarchaeales archaeon WOR_SM1_86-2]|nr:MAG: aspartate aminotransferase [Candidatus Altiarchaeales archaeon WOR_SM1_86-2]